MAAENKLLILADVAPAYLAMLDAVKLPQLQINIATDVDSAKTQLHDCNIILGDPPLIADILQFAPELDWVQSGWAGIDSLCRPGMRRDYLLTGAKGIFGSLISEYVMTYLFIFERQVFAMQRNQLNQHWRPLRYRPAHEITLGIVGLGSIGRQLAKTARHFGIRVIGLNRSGKACEHVEEVYTSADCAGFFVEPDYIVTTLPDTAETKHFINIDKLKLMRSSAVLMNVGRGSIVNEGDLVIALQQGLIGGAVLDVFEEEPLAVNNPLWNLPNVFITPHNAATSFPADIVSIFVENYRRFVRRESLLHLVDFELGY
jgi:phosphoglycerate dehydrogenase-like enzyme